MVGPGFQSCFQSCSCRGSTHPQARQQLFILPSNSLDQSNKGAQQRGGNSSSSAGGTPSQPPRHDNNSCFGCSWGCLLLVIWSVVAIVLGGGVGLWWGGCLMINCCDMTGNSPPFHYV
jgi:hypothetical protein